MNYGSVAYRGGAWHIACEAHVRAKLKRCFPEVNQRAAEVITLSDNDENCRDLLWFLDRYPMTVDNQERLLAGASQHVEQESRVSALLERRSPPADFVLARPPRDYQSMAASLAMIKGGLLVADDVGLGKTVTAICAMARTENLPVLVVTLTHLPRQWAAEINAFAPELSVHILKSGKPYDLIPKPKRGQGASFENEPRMPDVIITNYHKLNGWADVLTGVVRYVVFDEAQELRRDESNKYAAAKQIAAKAKLRMGLSATPIYNYGIEFFNVIDVLLPGELGTRSEFVCEWCSDLDRIRDPQAFGERLRRDGIMIRRTRADVGRELPPLTKIPQMVEVDHRALDRIKGSAVELARTILAVQQSHRGEKFMASEEFNVLMRQATGIAKAPYVAEFIHMLMESEQKIILYGWHRECYAIWMELLAEYNPRLYTGSESVRQKDEAKDAFVNGDCRLLIISLRAGAGLDGLQHVCSTGVFGELDWSPGVHEQCIGRYFRDGQKDAAMAYYLIAEDGSDPIVADVLGVKRGQMDGVVNPDAALIEQLESDPGNLRRLAEAYLVKHGIAIPSAEKVLAA